MARNDAAYVPSMLDRRIAVGLFLVAALVATLFFQLQPKWVNLDQQHGGLAKLSEEPRVGEHVAMGHGFRTPLDLSPDAEISAWVPPIYPLISGAAFRVFGVESRGALRVLLEINAIAFGLLIAGVFELGRLLMNRWVGLIGALLVLCDPMFLFFVPRFWHTMMVQAALVWLVIAALRTQRHGPTLARLAWIGAAFGLLIQANGSFILVMPFILWLAVRDVPIARWVPLGAAAGLAFAVVITPWTVRNFVQFHKLMYVRRGEELEMWIGNLPGSTGWQELSKHPSVYAPEHAKMLSMGEVGYFKYCHERFMENYRAAPAEYWKRCARRTLYLAIGEPSSKPMEWSHVSGLLSALRLAADGTIFLGGCIGLGLAIRLGFRVAWMIPLSIFSTAPYLISHMNYRFSLHIKVYLLMMIAFGVYAVWRRVRSGTWPQRDPLVNA